MSDERVDLTEDRSAFIWDDCLPQCTAVMGRPDGRFDGVPIGASHALGCPNTYGGPTAKVERHFIDTVSGSGMTACGLNSRALLPFKVDGTVQDATFNRDEVTCEECLPWARLRAGRYTKVAASRHPGGDLDKALDELPVVTAGGPNAGPLVRRERELLDVLADVANRFGSVIGRGASRDGDMAEAVHHIHALQRMVMAQAAARSYPSSYRLLGEAVRPS